MPSDDDSGQVGPIVFSNGKARSQLLNEGEVVTFRPSDRTTGETWWRKSRTGEKMGDCVVKRIDRVDPREHGDLEKDAPMAGFRTGEKWQDAIRDLHGELPESGYLYYVRATEGQCARCGEEAPLPTNDFCPPCGRKEAHEMRPDGGTDYRQSTPCDEHSQTLADDSPRGDAYMDDRTLLGVAYGGLALRAELYSEADVEHYREETTATVILTPAGECQLEGRCRTDPREPSDLARLEGASIVEAVASSTADRALRIAGQRQPYGGPDWFQSEGYPIREAMHRHTKDAVLRELLEETGAQADLAEFQTND